MRTCNFTGSLEVDVSKLLLATNNKGKIVEIQALLADMDIELETPQSQGVFLDVDESGQTYAENAELKGMAYTRATKLLTLADDSGLEVDALGGSPGIHSARYSPKMGATDADRRVYLLEKLQGKPRPWSARFRCIIALVTPSFDVHLAEGVCNGEIIPVERGQFGFGYDPIFFIPELRRTMAELGMAEKNQISHRARAVMDAKPLLSILLENLTDS